MDEIVTQTGSLLFPCHYPDVGASICEEQWHGNNSFCVFVQCHCGVHTKWTLNEGIYSLPLDNNNFHAVPLRDLQVKASIPTLGRRFLKKIVEALRGVRKHNP